MVVAVAVFEIHIPHAQSLKEKRTVVKSLRDRIRNRFEVSSAEVGLQDLHQRARLGVAIVSSEEKIAAPVLEEIARFIEQETTLLGWSHEMIPFDEAAASSMPDLKFE